MKCNDPENLNTGCNLNKTIRITTGIFYIQALFTGFTSNNKCESNRTMLLQKGKNYVVKNKILCDSNRFVRLVCNFFHYYKRLFSAACDVFVAYIQY